MYNDDRIEDEVTRATAPFARGAQLENTLFYMGSLMSVLVSSKESGGRLCLLEYRSQPGHEPPPHIHLEQEELLYILEGEVEVYAPGQKSYVGAGQCLFIPRGQAHAWYVLTDELRMLILTQPGGLDSYFETMGTPATSLELPSAATTYAMDDPSRAIRIGAEFGMTILTPEETKELLPHYPGFGNKPTPRRVQS
ncbi:cupin domain-containing protein [Acidicapsa ligni]|uniref:cupin domain-containing protein n=1 Tax=Acidicapsa ligni TaxID=542300 RepID=UPI0021E0C541|nr:cupin domain-containing protein [Acidicapsa ligni]